MFFVPFIFSSLFLGCKVCGRATQAATKLPKECNEQNYSNGARIHSQSQKRDTYSADALFSVSICQVLKKMLRFFHHRLI